MIRLVILERVCGNLGSSILENPFLYLFNKASYGNVLPSSLLDRMVSTVLQPSVS